MSEIEASGEAEFATRVVEATKTYSTREDARAMAAIKRAKGLGGVAGFGVTALAAYVHGELVASVLLRALAGGLVGYMVAWLAAVTVWRRIIRAEVATTVEEALAARRAAAAAAALAPADGP